MDQEDHIRPENEEEGITIMKLLGDSEIPKSRKSSREPHHSHKLLDIDVEMGLKLRDFIREDVVTTT